MHSQHLIKTAPCKPLFPPETCQGSIPSVRWQERPRHCPRCQNHNVGPWGAYHSQPGLQRYRCKAKGCKRPFQALTDTLLDGSKRSRAPFLLAPFLLCLACSARRIAREGGGHLRPRDRWGWGVRRAALS